MNYNANKSPVKNGKEYCKIIPAEKPDYDDIYFIMRKRGLVRNPEYRKFMGGKSTVYEHIWSMLIRGKLSNDPHKIKENYYDKGFLAYGSTISHVAKECFMDKKTVQKYIDEFIKTGAIKIEKIGPPPTKTDSKGRIVDKRKTVFILGTWYKEIKNDKEKIIERYYMDDIFYR